MRLIDADRLINIVKKWYWDKEQQSLHPDADLFINYFITTIKEQSTAYDIDKVVKELEECKWFNDMWVTINKAIEIVKAGERMIDLEKPMHFTKEQSEWIKAYCIIRNKEAYNQAIDDFKHKLSLDVMQKYYFDDDGFINLNNCALMICDIAEQLTKGKGNE